MGDVNKILLCFPPYSNPSFHPFYLLKMNSSLTPYAVSEVSLQLFIDELHNFFKIKLLRCQKRRNPYRQE